MEQCSGLTRDRWSSFHSLVIPILGVIPDKMGNEKGWGWRRTRTSWAFPRRTWSQSGESSHLLPWQELDQPHPSLAKENQSSELFWFLSLSHLSTWWGRKARQGHWSPRWSSLQRGCVQSPSVCCRPCLLLSSSPLALPSWKLLICASPLPSCQPRPR